MALPVKDMQNPSFDFEVFFVVCILYLTCSTLIIWDICFQETVVQIIDHPFYDFRHFKYT